ncbi:MAG: DNA gyrase modulator, partial [Thermodesulfobacteriota bacterium]|nr:DNA gyrase modulator [Thermodesulfobacteriota bacterium]
MFKKIKIYVRRSMIAPGWIQDIAERLDGERALRKAMSRGGDLADLFWEEVTLTSMILEDGRLEKVVTGMDTGANLRTVFNDHQAFASTNELSPARLMDLAGTVAQAVDQGRELSMAEVKPGLIGPAFEARIRSETIRAG